MSSNVKSMLCYFPFGVGIVLSIVWLVTEKDDKTVRFNAIQSIFFEIALYLVSFVLGIIIGILFYFLAGFISWILGVLVSVLLVYLMYKNYTGEVIELPIIGPLAKQYA